LKNVIYSLIYFFAMESAASVAEDTVVELPEVICSEILAPT
jgi:hypothetical protein